MATNPEKEKPNQQIEFVPDEVSPLTIERKEVVTPVPTQFTAQVTDDSGKPIIQTPTSTTPSIQVPDGVNNLTSASQGSTDDSGTWFAAFWLRMIKKALHFGWRVFTGGKDNK